MDIRIYMGWDSNEQLAFNVAAHSFYKHNKDTDVIPLKLNELPELTRPIEMRGNQMWCPISDAAQTTEFSISRFLVPHLAKTGWALFCDCDVVCMADIQEIMQYADPKYAVLVVKHNYEPQDEVHMVDKIQVKLPRKNWASVILWNCDHPANKKLTLEVINTWPGRDLHQFKWLQDSEIGELPVEWNYLVGVSGTSQDTKWGQDIKDPIKLAHFTLGGPWIERWDKQPTDRLWLEAYVDYMGSKVL
jgi:lipopolysaccharide biosynthesis glycosyltransferase